MVCIYIGVRIGNSRKQTMVVQQVNMYNTLFSTVYVYK